MQTISVTRTDGGWQLSSNMGTAPLMFRGGKAAERAAMRLGEAVGATGELVRIEVRLSDGTVARRFVSPQIGRGLMTSDVEWAGGRTAPAF